MTSLRRASLALISNVLSGGLVVQGCSLLIRRLSSIPTSSRLPLLGSVTLFDPGVPYHICLFTGEDMQRKEFLHTLLVYVTIHAFLFMNYFLVCVQSWLSQFFVSLKSQDCLRATLVHFKLHSVRDLIRQFS